MWTQVSEFQVEGLPIQLLRGTVDICHLFSYPLLMTMLNPSRVSYCTKRAIWMNTFTDILLLCLFSRHVLYLVFCQDSKACCQRKADVFQSFYMYSPSHSPCCRFIYTMFQAALGQTAVVVDILYYNVGKWIKKKLWHTITRTIYKDLSNLSEGIIELMSH